MNASAGTHRYGGVIDIPSSLPEVDRLAEMLGEQAAAALLGSIGRLLLPESTGPLPLSEHLRRHNVAMNARIQQINHGRRTRRGL